MQSIRKTFCEEFRQRFQAKISPSTVRTVTSHKFNEDLKDKEFRNEDKRPLWFIFSGLGSQVNTLPKELFSFEPFAESMRESRVTMRNLGLDLDQLLKPKNDRIFMDIQAAFVSLAAVQVALYDTLQSVFNTTPSGYIGHSAGELLCGYADGCLTAEQVLVVSDVRGRAMQEARPVLGAMAAIGMSWPEIENQCPPDVYPACNNASKNVTVSGSLHSVLDFVNDLQSQGIYAKVVDSCDCSPHSPLASDAAELFRKNLQGVIPNERRRSSKWICTSARANDWHLKDVSHCTGEYFVRNMLQQVWFYEALRHIPNRALVVEVSPRTIFQGILKQSVSKDCVHFTPILRQGDLNPLLSSEACSLLQS